MQPRFVLVPCLLFLALSSARPAAAGDSLSFPFVRLDLFGGLAWGRAGDGVYLDATEAGEFENGNLAINARHDFSPVLAGIAQVELTRKPGETEVELDYFFLDWRPTDNSTLRFGRTKQPFGIYSEFYDLGTDRPFYDLPQGIYGPTEIVAESLDGLSYQSRRDLAKGELRLDVYAGKVRFEATEPWEGLGEDSPGLEADEEDIDRNETLGLRLEWQHRSGLTLGLSAFRGKDEHAADSEEFGKALAAGVHLIWERGDWLVRAEAVHFEEGDNLDITAAYVEAARHFGQHWQGAVRWDRSSTTVAEADLEELGAAALGEHRDVAVGLDYWVNSGLVLKLSHHWVEGERFLAGEDGERAEDGTGMWRFGVQFLY